MLHSYSVSHRTRELRFLVLVFSLKYPVGVRSRMAKFPPSFTIHCPDVLRCVGADDMMGTYIHTYPSRCNLPVGLLLLFAIMKRELWVLQYSEVEAYLARDSPGDTHEKSGLRKTTSPSVLHTLCPCPSTPVLEGCNDELISVSLKPRVIRFLCRVPIPDAVPRMLCSGYHFSLHHFPSVTFASCPSY